MFRQKCTGNFSSNDGNCGLNTHAYFLISTLRLLRALRETKWVKMGNFARLNH